MGRRHRPARRGPRRRTAVGEDVAADPVGGDPRGPGRERVGGLRAGGPVLEGAQSGQLPRSRGDPRADRRRGELDRDGQAGPVGPGRRVRLRADRVDPGGLQRRGEEGRPAGQDRPADLRGGRGPRPGDARDPDRRGGAGEGHVAAGHQRREAGEGPARRAARTSSPTRRWTSTSSAACRRRRSSRSPRRRWSRPRRTSNTSEANLAYTKITSPVDGVIIDRKVDPGQTVASQFQTPELFIVAPDMRKEMHVFASVDEADIGLIRDAQEAGQPVHFTVDAYPDDLFEGKIFQIRRNSTTTQNVVTYPVRRLGPEPRPEALARHDGQHLVPDRRERRRAADPQRGAAVLPAARAGPPRGPQAPGRRRAARGRRRGPGRGVPLGRGEGRGPPQARPAARLGRGRRIPAGGRGRTRA